MVKTLTRRSIADRIAEEAISRDPELELRYGSAEC